MQRVSAQIVLEDGFTLDGFSFGALRSVEGEVVFTTGMTGYPQSLTDPSFANQILVMTYPLIGNYGVPPNTRDEYGIEHFFESSKIWLKALVVEEACASPSHFNSTESLATWLTRENIAGIEGIDTRALTMHLRERGVMRGKIIIEGKGSDPNKSDEDNPLNLRALDAVKVYTNKNSSTSNKTKVTIALIDCGAKNNIIRSLLKRGVDVVRVPYGCELPNNYDGIFLSNGPGDPKSYTHTIELLKTALTQDKPIFGICLGNQLMALASGADTYKLPYGHRGQNQPCIDVRSGRCYITSQNHGYAVREESLRSDWEPWFINNNDGTIEGIRHRTKNQCAVQFHPEGCPGPQDSDFLFDDFIANVKLHKEQK